MKALHWGMPKNPALKVLFLTLWFLYTFIFVVVMLLPHLFLRWKGRKGFMELEIKFSFDFRGVPYKEAIEEE